MANKYEIQVTLFKENGKNQTCVVQTEYRIASARKRYNNELQCRDGRLVELLKNGEVLYRRTA